MENFTVSKKLRTALAHKAVIKYRINILAALQNEELQIGEVWRFVRWRIWRGNLGFSGAATKYEVNAFLHGSYFAQYSSMLARACSVITPALADASVILQNRDEINRITRSGRRNNPKTSNLRQISVAPSDLPLDWRNCLEAMARGEAGANGKCMLVPHQIYKMGHTLCALCFTCREAELPLSINRATVVAYIQALAARNCSHVTICSRLTELKTFLLYSGIAVDLLEELSREIAVHERIGRSEEKRKEAFLRETGLAQTDIAGAACKVLATIEADRAKRVCEMTRRARSRDAALLALSLGAAPREADVTELIVDVSMKRGSDFWTIDYTTLKTDADIEFGLDPRLTPFLDQAILLGASQRNFRNLYALRKGTPFFVADNSFQKLARRWPYKRMTLHIGTGTHISRTLWYNAEYDRNAGDVRAARAMLGHRDRDIQDAYLTPRAYANAAVNAASVLTDLAEEFED